MLNFPQIGGGRLRLISLGLATILVAAFMLPRLPAFAQDGDGAGPSSMEVNAPSGEGGDETAADGKEKKKKEGINILSLILSGGVLMIPLAMLSIACVALAIERFVALRSSKIIPAGLVQGLGTIGGGSGGFDPRKAYRLCQQHPSAASTVIRAMLMKVGRPHQELEHTAAEFSQRESERLYFGVSWLNLIAAVAPLVGLLGTVWGMIVVFHDLTNLLPTDDKSKVLSAGIFTAMVTTLTGLIIALPAAICSHFYENRIKTYFHQIDDLLFNLLPQVERYEGRVRFSQPIGEETGTGAKSSTESTAAPPEPPAPQIDPSVETASAK